jgi:hypothetical protein
MWYLWHKCTPRCKNGIHSKFKLHNKLLGCIIVCRCMKLLYRVEGTLPRAILKKYISAPSTEVINISWEVALRILLGGGDTFWLWWYPLRALSSLALSFLERVACHYQWAYMLGKLALVYWKSDICPWLIFMLNYFYLEVVKKLVWI